MARLKPWKSMGRTRATTNTIKSKAQLFGEKIQSMHATLTREGEEEIMAYLLDHRKFCWIIESGPEDNSTKSTLTCVEL